ncbi:AfsR/SARP family transcriptional regulator [Streptomyces sp. NPDC054940]
MEIKVLGPLDAQLAGSSIVPTAGKPRQILALLALHRNRIMPVPTLMEEIWGTELPRSALTTLQTYILQLRRRIGAALGPDSPHTAKDILVTSHGGYLLRTPPDALDAHVYEQLVEQGRTAFDAGDNERASCLLRQALEMWRGPALVDVRAGTILEVETVRLEESRLGTLELRIHADLGRGRHAALLTELTALVARHPLHEGLHSQAMVALYRCGRQAQALDVYHALRGRLVEELGLEPSTQLQRVHHAVLTADPALDVPGVRQAPAFQPFAA